MSPETTQPTVKVLDKGFVRLVDMMGGDQGVVDAARVSYGGRSKGADSDKKLISYLLKHSHLTPFEHSLLKFHCRAPIFVARQWFRHRFAAYNEISFRYTEVKDDFYMPEKWRGQDKKNKQGSMAGADLDQEMLNGMFKKQVDGALETYKKMIAMGTAREMARMVLPVNLYTEFYWTVNARSLMNFVALRADAHAQWEIQKYGEAMAKLFREKMPWTYEAFLRHGWRGDNEGIAAERAALPPLEAVAK
ncbi:MAG TPA: FAD-dependent thymidylate synthase [Elusimicrobia bacterium]|nr:MAG: FAD-dependent thymidylate synthase [Elusimicrobia bacterium GWA2_66_18]OGR71774.1 MAG: FAD-dependent thymidylate synthase [Elusimicrobia bacterium GWC2_65_9]HAZ09183.1 FAD-dependent thymidylate synthase [Elusimicrobiota bacterium]